jgi:ubiquinone/menaquinone biosynthesis C-methylase UbiE
MFLAKKKDRLIREVARLAKRGGRVVVIDWKTVATPIGPPMDERVSDAEVKRLFHLKEFEFERIFMPGKFHYGLVFKRTDAKHVPSPASKRV